MSLKVVSGDRFCFTKLLFMPKIVVFQDRWSHGSSLSRQVLVSLYNLLGDCREGTFIVGRTCEACPVGMYQPNIWQFDCLNCPPLSTTNTTATSYRWQCNGKASDLNYHVIDLTAGSWGKVLFVSLLSNPFILLYIFLLKLYCWVLQVPLTTIFFYSIHRVCQKPVRSSQIFI